MGDSLVTRRSLLVRLGDARDGEAWSQFVEVYAPLIYGFSRKQGLQDADAADVVQDVLRSVASALGKFEYDAQRGSFRAWLFTVARNKVRDFCSARHRQPRGTGDTAAYEVLQQQPAPAEVDSWESDYDRRLFAWAAEQVQREVHETTWQAFHRTAVAGQSGKDVAAALGMSVAAVYLAKSRVMSRLKELVQQVQGDELSGFGLLKGDEK